MVFVEPVIIVNRETTVHDSIFNSKYLLSADDSKLYI
jgi:hypothetical protein